MAKRKSLTVVGYLIMPDGTTKRVEDLTPEERTRWDKERTERLKRVMTDYYKQHPEEYEKLPTADIDE